MNFFLQLLCFGFTRAAASAGVANAGSYTGPPGGAAATCDRTGDVDVIRGHAPQGFAPDAGIVADAVTAK